MIHAEQASCWTGARRRLVASTAVAVLIVAGCSASGAKKLTAADLSKAMPTAQEVGPDFHRDKAGENDNSNDSTLKVSAKCKKLLNSDPDKGKPKAKRNFKDSKEREIDVSATVSDVSIASLEKTAKSCARVPFTSKSTRGTITFKLSPIKDIGDDADALELTLSITAPISLELHGHGVFAKRGDVGMSVVGLDGINQQATVTPIDNAAVDKAARALDQKIKDAQG